MMGLSTARLRSKLSSFETPSPEGWRNVVWSYIQTKTRIVYCKDADRRATYANERFDFLGYTFRPRLSRSKFGKFFANFSAGGE